MSRGRGRGWPVWKERPSRLEELAQAADARGATLQEPTTGVADDAGEAGAQPDDAPHAVLSVSTTPASAPVILVCRVFVRPYENEK